MEVLMNHRKDVEEELRNLILEEEKIDKELQHHFLALKKPSLAPTSGFYEPSSVGSELKKVENVAPMLESLSQNAKKLSGQVEDCRSLSDRLSNIVRQLDMKQMRAGKALACTEDILNLKDSRAKIFAALENNDLPTAVKHLKHVHSIDKHALEISDDYHQILSKEAEIKSKVQQAFQAAIESSDIEQVMLYCPLLQFLQLQYEARDNLLLFFNEKIFISLDSEHVLANTNATDASTAYLQGLLHIFNTFYIIIQTYLPIVLQGLEECSGDIYFIRNLHKKVELEASRIIKKFIKYRNLNEFVQNLARFPPQSSSSTTATNASMMSAAEIHALMDEVAVVIQYCSKYSKYLKHIAHGAEARVRPSPTTATSSAAPSNPQTVFTYPLDFDKMIDELVSKYYLVGDYYLIKSVALNPSNLDVLYFVLQKCGLRSIATNHIHATLSIHQLIINTISGEVVDSLNSSMGPAVAKILSTVNDYYQKYKKPLIDMNSTAMNASSSNNILSRGLFSLISTSSSSSSSSGGDHHASSSSAAQEDLSMIMEMFNTMEVAASYTERLGKDLFAAGENVFSSSFDQSSPSTTSHAASTATATANTSKGTGKKAKETTSVFHIASDVEKLQACRESFESAKQSLFNLMKQVAEKVTMGLHPIFKDLFYLTADPAHSNLFIQYNLPDQRFEDQSNLVVLPRIIVVPVENILYLLTNNLSEKAKSLLIAFTAEVCCEKLEGFIRQTTFSFAGAMKMEELVRTLNGLFTRYSNSSVRMKFTRLREMMLVLTSPSLGDSLNENYTLLTANEIEAVFGLRIEATS